MSLAVLATVTACGAPTPAKSPVASTPSSPPTRAVAAPFPNSPAASATSPSAPLQPTVGVNAVVRNSVTTRGFGETAQHPSTAQGPVRFLDQIATGDAAQLKVVFNDQSDLSLGAYTQLSVDRFVYDPSPGVTGVGVAVVRGVFRFASRRPGEERESFRTPTAAIGVRGTMFDAAVGPLVLVIVGKDAGGLGLADDPATAALIVLRQGVIEVRTAERTVTLRRPGQAVVVSGRHVSDPFYPAPGDDRRLLGRLPPLVGFAKSGPGPTPGDYGPRGPGSLGPSPDDRYLPRPSPGGGQLRTSPSGDGSGRPPSGGGLTGPRGLTDQGVTPGAGSGPVYRPRPTTTGGGSSPAKPAGSTSAYGPPPAKPTGQPVAAGGPKPLASSSTQGPGTQPPVTGNRAVTTTAGSLSGQPPRLRPVTTPTGAKPASGAAAKKKPAPAPVP